jgi:hypothetical protein
MGCAWNRGNHAYFGKLNSRGGRQWSKVFAGIKIKKRALKIAFYLIQKEHENNLNKI